MGTFFDQVPITVKDHVKDVTRTSGLPNTEDSLELMSESWLGKMEAFEREIEAHGMEVVTSMDKDDDRGVLVMTYSGSLINIGPDVDGTRNVEYSSIGLRSDVPDSAEHNASILGSDINLDLEVEFAVGPVESTSSVFKIAVCKDDLSAEDQEEALSNATLILSKEFADINKTLIME